MRVANDSDGNHNTAQVPSPRAKWPSSPKGRSYRLIGHELGLAGVANRTRACRPNGQLALRAGVA